MIETGYIDAIRRQTRQLWSTFAKDSRVPTSQLDLIQHLIHRIENLEEEAGYVEALNPGSATADKMDTQGR